MTYSIKPATLSVALLITHIARVAAFQVEPVQ